jgi:nitrate/TMAO reductase-like tetraheme cytochrome c subunit
MKADQASSLKSREVTLQKRSLIFAAALVALLVLAVPALAGPGVQGYRADYVNSSICAGCHTTGTFAPAVYNDWAGTKHGQPSAAGQESRGPESQCAGCHVSNYDPTKVSPSPTPSGTKTAWVYPYSVASVPADLTTPYPFSEGGIGCSSCHYGTSLIGGTDANDTAHLAPFVQLANADICGQCHSRYSYSVTAFHVNPTPTAGAPTDAIVQTQYAVGFQMLGNPGNSWIADPLSSVLLVQSPGWTPTPVPSTAATPATPGIAANLMQYWQDASGTTDTVWQRKGHDGSAAQYPEWLTSKHASSLTDLKALVPAAVIDGAGCLKCHSADYQIAQAAGKPAPSASQAQYGDTCVSCHTPHKAGTAKGVWDEAFDAQLVGDPANPSDVCIRCHTAQLAGGTAVPGQEIHNTTKEIMAGTGAIGVPDTPGVHEGKCIDCHMPPTSWSRGSIQLGGNHTMTIIDPKVAANVSPIPVATVTPSPWATSSATPNPATSVVTSVMPFSACSTCHGRSSDPLATYLSDTITQRHATMHSKIDAVNAALVTGAVNLGYVQVVSPAESDSAFITRVNGLLNGIGIDNWTASQLNWQKAFTNVMFVNSEGSYGVHNYQYAVAVADKALSQAQAVKAKLTGISIAASRSGIVYGRAVTISGAITGGDYATLVGGQVQLWAKATSGTNYAPVATDYLSGDGANEYSFSVMPNKNMNYKVLFLGNDTYEKLWSSSTSVTVAYKVTLKAKPALTKVGSVVRFSGRVMPVPSAGRVKLQKKVGTAWKTIRTRTVNTTTGAFVIRKTMTAKGRFSFRAIFPRDANHRAGRSAIVKVIVK